MARSTNSIMYAIFLVFTLISFCYARSTPNGARMEALPALKYFSEPSMRKIGGDLTEQECLKECLDTWSCKAAVYRKETKSCFQAEELPAMNHAQFEGCEDATYMKMEGRGREMLQLKGRTKAIVITVIVVVIVAVLACVCCVFKCLCCCI